MIKVICGILCSSSLLIANSSFTNNYYRYAQTVHDASLWVNTYCISKSGEQLISTSDLHAVLTYFYVACQRSQSTLRANKQSIEFLNNCWQSWQHVIQRRRNPSKTTAHARTHATLAHQAAEFSSCVADHDYWASAYEATADDLFNNRGIIDEHLLDGLAHVKQETRKLISQALLAAHDYVDQLIDAFAGNRCLIEDTQEDDDTDIVRSSIISYLQEQLPAWSVASFTKTDNLFINTSLHHWNSLYHAQKNKCGYLEYDRKRSRTALLHLL